MLYTSNHSHHTVIVLPSTGVYRNRKFATV